MSCLPEAYETVDELNSSGSPLRASSAVSLFSANRSWYHIMLNGSRLESIRLRQLRNQKTAYVARSLQLQSTRSSAHTASTSKSAATAASHSTIRNFRKAHFSKTALARAGLLSLSSSAYLIEQEFWRIANEAAIEVRRAKYIADCRERDEAELARNEYLKGKSIPGRTATGVHAFSQACNSCLIPAQSMTSSPDDLSSEVITIGLKRTARHPTSSETQSLEMS